MNERKFTVSFPSIKYLICISALLVALRIFNCIDWSPILLLFPIWFPYAFAVTAVIFVYFIKYFLLTVFWCVDKFVDICRKIFKR